MTRSPLWNAFLVTAILVAFFIGLSLLTLPWLRQGESWTGGGEKVGVVEVKGLIADSRTVIKQLDRYKEDRGIKAVVLRVSSPSILPRYPRAESFEKLSLLIFLFRS